MSIDKPALDLGYRPESYFWPITHDTHLIGAIKGERRRKAIRAAFDADRVTPLDERERSSSTRLGRFRLAVLASRSTRCCRSS